MMRFISINETLVPGAPSLTQLLGMEDAFVTPAAYIFQSFLSHNHPVVPFCLLVCMLMLSVIVILQVGQKAEQGARNPNAPAGLFFQHAGHRFVISFTIMNGMI